MVDEALLLFVTSEENPPNSLAQLISYTSRQSLTLSFIHQVFLTLGAAVLNIALVLSLKHCCCCRKQRSTLASPPAPPDEPMNAPPDTPAASAPPRSVPPPPRLRSHLQSGPPELLGQRRPAAEEEPVLHLPGVGGDARRKVVSA